jgi:hypothetical protein
MGTKPKIRKQAPVSVTADEALTDAGIDRFLATEHRAIEAKLAEARKSINGGNVASLESVPKLLRAARRNTKPVR